MAAHIRPTCIWQAVRVSRRPQRPSLFPTLLSHQLCVRRQSLSTTTDSTSTPQPSQLYIPANSKPNSTPQLPGQFEPLSYFVHRTPSQQLPIYHLAKRGGNKHQTRIRRISGRIESLRDDLKQALGLGEKEIAINSVNGHIVIKGWRKVEVAKFLLEKKF